ncbi:ABC transporter ATP-binding protein [Jiangella anatolica]|uniref:Fatty acid ABC transporter ATP-binding/permease protein n=1 Tax=Jiangella anatolica TaxID=2670374 RepID=A0A2W2C1B2_9ACTN|nr:ABC transporter ATP-binding protein [Jiangella anatolica]PZF82009.1 multidrug ABC transporter ATP-binding protein [Jiangella anatolica]
MSASRPTTTTAPARPAGPGGPGPLGRGGGPFGGMAGPPQKALDFVPSAKRLLGRLAPERAGVALVIALALVSVTLNAIGPRLLGHGTDLIFQGVIGRQLPEGVSKDEAIEDLRADGQGTFADMLSGMDVVPGQGVDFGALQTVLLGVLALYVGASLFMWIQAYLLNTIVQRTVFRLRSDVEDKIHRLPLKYFDANSRGDVLSRVTNDIDNVSQSLQQTMSQLLNSLLTVVGVLAMMIWISPLLALIALVTIPLSMIVTTVIAKRSQKQFVAQWAHTGALNGQIEEAYTGHALVQVFGRQREVEQSFAGKNEELYQASFGAQFVSGLIMPAMFFLGNLNYVAIAVVGGLRVASGTMTLGDVQAFVQYTRQFTQPLTQLASMANLLQSGVASAERVFQLLDEPEQVPDPASPATLDDPPRGRVEFEHVTFSYDPDQPLIEDLSLVAEPGQTVAIVGPTGAGKTTLVNLIMRFYELQGGRITIDGRDIAGLSRDELRGSIGMVLQDTWLFGGTIRENLAYGDPSAPEERIRAAAEATYVDRFVHSLPDGYDTVIDEEGDNISAGEKQLLTIARAFLADPSILILDEATSSVDTRTEVLVQHAMAALRSDRTSFVIAHRLSTIRDADLILVMRDGAIVEQGSHAELLERRGAYFDLYNSQFALPAVEE